jgi:hypothetical protein
VIIVEVNGEEIEFPDSMSSQEIAAALMKQRAPKTEVIDLSPLQEQLQTVVDLISSISEKLAEEQIDRFPELLTELAGIKEVIPEMPDDRFPELLNALADVCKAVSVTVEAPIVNIPESIINVDAPIVNVDAPDMTEVTEAVRAIKMPGLQKVEEILRGIKMSVDINKPPKPNPLIIGARVISRGVDGDADVIEFIYEGDE